MLFKNAEEVHPTVFSLGAATAKAWLADLCDLLRWGSSI